MLADTISIAVPVVRERVRRRRSVPPFVSRTDRPVRTAGWSAGRTRILNWVAVPCLLCDPVRRVKQAFSFGLVSRHRLWK